MGLLGRVRAQLVHAPADQSWDDADVESVAADMTSLAGAWDPEPDDDRLARSRAATLGAFAAAMTDRSESLLGVPGRTPPPTGIAPGLHRGGRRPVLVPVAAAILLAVSVGTVAASVPGGPLYGVRIASENLFLPGAPDDRARAQVERLDLRLAEASDAAARGDTGAVSAALGAYADIADEAAAGTPPDPSTASGLALRIQVQQALISSIDPGDAALGVVRERARVAAGVLLGAFGAPGGGPGPVPSPNPAPPTATPTPGATAKPGGPGATTGPGMTGAPGTGGGPAGPSGSGTPGGSGPSVSPGGQGPSPSPAGSGGPKATTGSGGTGTGGTGTGGSASPNPTGSPQPAVTPRASGNPSAGPGSGPGTGTVTGGETVTVAGGAEPTGSPALERAGATASPGSRP